MRTIKSNPIPDRLRYSIDRKHFIGTTIQHLREKLSIKEMRYAIFAEFNQAIDCLHTLRK
ncbi:hypothetical protein XH81_04110 [Bradyrhizobium sp. CCBAU 25360]|nr:hypothetical protein [Bradyrhizobium sp. CCBAU 25360]